METFSENDNNHQDMLRKFITKFLESVLANRAIKLMSAKFRGAGLKKMPSSFIKIPTEI